MYLVIKTSQEQVDRCGSLFEAARGHWRLDPNHASQCSHAVISLIGSKVIQAVYTIDKWYESTLIPGKQVFAGNVDSTLENKLVGKILNSALCKKGMEYPTLYVEEKDLLEA